jgi:hypothetical protein
MSYCLPTHSPENGNRSSFRHVFFESIREWTNSRKSVIPRVWVCLLNSVILENGPMPGSCEHGNELLGSIKGSEFLNQKHKC